MTKATADVDSRARPTPGGLRTRRNVGDVPINDVVKKFEKKRDELGFAPDEKVLAGCMTNPMAGVGGAVGGLAGAMVQIAAEKRRNPPADGGMAAQWPAGKHLMAITSKRLVVADMSALSGRPKKVLAEWPHSDIEGVEVEKKAMAYHFAVVFADGSVAEGDAAKGTGADELGDAAASVWGSPPVSS